MNQPTWPSTQDYVPHPLNLLEWRPLQVVFPWAVVVWSLVYLFSFLSTPGLGISSDYSRDPHSVLVMPLDAELMGTVRLCH